MNSELIKDFLGLSLPNREIPQELGFLLYDIEKAYLPEKNILPVEIFANETRVLGLIKPNVFIIGDGELEIPIIAYNERSAYDDNLERQLVSENRRLVGLKPDDRITKLTEILGISLHKPSNAQSAITYRIDQQCVGHIHSLSILRSISTYKTPDQRWRDVNFGFRPHQAVFPILSAADLMISLKNDLGLEVGAYELPREVLA